jgi:hypothetical protein
MVLLNINQMTVPKKKKKEKRKIQQQTDDKDELGSLIESLSISDSIKSNLVIIIIRRFFPFHYLNVNLFMYYVTLHYSLRQSL